jgi:hypothetical protein
MTATQLALVTATPQDIHADARRHVWLAIETAAALDSGYISQNVVRACLAAMPEWGNIPRGVVGAVYRDLVHQGVIVEVGTERTTGSTSGNNGRLAPTYQLVTA